MGKIRSWIEFARRKPGEACVVAVLVMAAICYGGTKPEPPPSVTEEGIKLTRANVTPSGVDVAWETEDPRVKPGAVYIVEFRKRPVMLGDTVVESPDDLRWKELGRTTDRGLVRAIFLLDSTCDIRVRTDITEVGE